MMHARRWLVSIPCCLAAAAMAADGPPGGWRTSASLTPVYLAGADIDEGGSYESRVLALNIGAVRSWGPRVTAGAALNYAYYDNRFTGAGAFGTAAPWGDVERVGVSAPVFARSEGGWAFVLTPSVDYFHERGADWGESLTYGAVMSASRSFGPKRNFGLGLGVFQQLEEVTVFPLLVVDWQLTERLRLDNPLPAGPTGPAGLELNYRANASWEVGVGAAWRRVRFRLREDGTFPGGVGEESGTIVFAHTATRVSEDVILDLYAGALLGGRLHVEDDDGDRIARRDFDTTPLLGATLRVRF